MIDGMTKPEYAKYEATASVCNKLAYSNTQLYFSLYDALYKLNTKEIQLINETIDSLVWRLIRNNK